MSIEKDVEPSQRFLKIEYRLSQSAWDKFKRQSVVSEPKNIEHKAEVISDTFLERNLAKNELLVITSYAYADILLPKHYDMIFIIDDLESNAKCNVSINAGLIIIGNAYVVNTIGHGHRHICLLSFENTIPNLFDRCYTLDDTFKKIEGDTIALGLCHSVDFPHIVRFLNGDNT